MKTRKKSVSLIYNGTEAYSELAPYLEQITYTDSVDESDMISLELSDRDLKWRNAWIPQKGDILIPALTLEDWNYEGEKMTIQCGSFIVDDFGFSSPPAIGNINGVSSPVNTGFKETENTKTWEAATVQLIAGEIAGKYGLNLVYEAQEIAVAKIEQDKRTDSDFLKTLCEKYGLGLKVFYNRLVIWDYREYLGRTPITEIKPEMCSKWSYRSSMQGTYTGARVSYKNPKTKKMVDVLVGTEERLYKTNQKADSEADARLIGEAAIRNANRRESTMQLIMPPQLLLMATLTVRLNGFGQMDGAYFIEKVTHQIGRKAYVMQVLLSRIPESDSEKISAPTEAGMGNVYIVKKGDNLWDLSQKFYGTPSRCEEIYRANKDRIETEAREHGKSNSSNGYWIWPGTPLDIPL